MLLASGEIQIHSPTYPSRFPLSYNFHHPIKTQGDLNWVSTFSGKDHPEIHELQILADGIDFK